MFDAIAGLMAWFYSIWPSYGMAIAFLTVCVMLVLFPLTAKQVRSMQAMAKLQPEIKRLQSKYKTDRQKLNEEMMKFYRENKVNPLSSCLPLLLQMPIFFVLYRVVAGLSTRDPNNLGGPRYLDPDSEMWQAIKDAGFKLHSFGMDLAQRAVDAHGSFVKALPFYLLVGLVMATAYYQQRQMTKRTPQSAQNPQMVMLGKIMPVFFGFISLSIPAGVVLYFFVSNLFRIGQQWLLARLAPADDTAKADRDVIEAKEVDEPPKPRGKPSPTARPKPVPRPSGRGGDGGNGRAQGRPGGGGAGGSRSKKGKRKR